MWHLAGGQVLARVRTGVSERVPTRVQGRLAHARLLPLAVVLDCAKFLAHVQVPLARVQHLVRAKFLARVKVVSRAAHSTFLARATILGGGQALVDAADAGILFAHWTGVVQPPATTVASAAMPRPCVTRRRVQRAAIDIALQEEVGTWDGSEW